MSDWKDKRKADRELELENDILLMKSRANENEKIITAVENEDVTVSVGCDGKMCSFGSEVKTKSLYLSTPGDVIRIAAGANAEDIAVISISRLMGEASKLTVIKDDKEDTVDLVFQGKSALGVVHAFLKAVALMMEEDK